MSRCVRPGALHELTPKCTDPEWWEFRSGPQMWCWHPEREVETEGQGVLL